MTKRSLFVGFGEVGFGKSVRWQDLETVNFMDFDRIGFDFRSWTLGALSAEVVSGFHRLLGASGECDVCFVGVPPDFFQPRANQLRWFPVLPELVVESGRRFSVVSSDYQQYFDEVKTYPCHFGELPPPRETEGPLGLFARMYGASDRPAVVRFESLAGIRNRHVAIALWFEVDLRPCTEMLFLPPPDKAKSAALALLELWGETVTTTLPSWVPEHRLPHHERAQRDLELCQAAHERAVAALHTSKDACMHEERFTKLLFEQSDVLEKIVIEAMEVLGASFRPVPTGVQDGYLDCPAGTAVLEIKGKKGISTLKDLRQLQTWVDDVYEEEHKNVEGILVVNAFRMDDPASREESFSPHVIDLAKRRGLRLLTTIQLFNAVRAHQQDEFDPTSFWSAVFEADPIVAWPSIAD